MQDISYNFIHINNYKNYVFIILIFLVKLFLGIYFISPVVSEWYIPFMESTLSTTNLDFYENFKNNVSEEIAFPYGYGFILYMYPIFKIFDIININFNVAYNFGIALSDLLIFFILCKINSTNYFKILFFYWCNPIILICSYFLGFNDLIPILFLLISIYFIRSRHFIYASLFLALSVSVKISMLLAIPIFFIYFNHNRKINQNFIKFALFTFLFITLLEFPHFYSDAAFEMLITNPYFFDTIFLQEISLGKNKLLIIPVLFSIFLYLLWSLRRLSFSLFINLLGIFFLIIAVMTSTSPGWFLWSIPFIILSNLEFTKKDHLLIITLIILFFVQILILGPNGIYDSVYFSYEKDFLRQFTSYIDIFNSLYFATLIIFIIRILKIGIIDHDYFRCWRQPFLIGIAGNSGVGKTSLAKKLEDIIGKNSVSHLKGDSYHIWDRNKPIWNTLTHLNPRANELEKLNNDLSMLISEKKIHTSSYDHTTGKKFFNNFIVNNNFIIAEGLHIFIFNELRNKCGVRIFLDIEEKLRRKFKIDRDVDTRGYDRKKVLFNLDRRKDDEKKYIESQKKFSDLIITVRSTKNFDYNQNGNRLVVEIVSKEPSYYETISKLILTHSNLGVETDYTKENKMIINGIISKFSITKIYKAYIKKDNELMDIDYLWDEGPRGLIQLICIIEIFNSLKKRIN